MARRSNEEKARRARESLIQTITKIDDLEPTLGLKWRTNMLNYYCDRLAELVLYQAGFNNPSKDAIQAVKRGIVDTLEIQSENS